MRTTSRTYNFFRPGIALVLVIAFVGFLTLLAVSLLSLATSNRVTNHLENETQKAEMLAQSAFNTVLADLGNELQNGATTVTETNLDDGTKLRRYDFTGKPQGIIASKALKSASLDGTHLVKQSASGVPFHPYGAAAPTRASASSTAVGLDPLDPLVWAKPQLLPAGTVLTKDNSPDWIYINRTGQNPKAFSEQQRKKGSANVPNPEFVIGRYAYNLYDTSGMLDINAAGYPAGGVDAERLGHKGSQALADLNALPGMTATAVDNLAKWKHDWSKNIISTVPDPVPPAIPPTPAQEYISFSESKGWNVLAGNDNVFLNRQDMLRFSRLYPGTLPETALASLTHFSRDLDAPSYRPDPNRPKIKRSSAQGGNDAYNLDAQINPDMMSVDKVRKSYLLSRRFPLERLKWVSTPDSTGPVDAAKAERYFGLKWKTDHWEYVHADSGGGIKTLENVPVDREPDFFEILQATVLAGSLGRQYGATGFAAGPELTQQWSYKLGGIDSSIGLNILEMGASIIDQADADSYPTALALVTPGRTFWAYGKEDVPYLYRNLAVPYRGKELPNVKKPAGSTPQDFAYEVQVVLQCGLWRPHQPVENYEGPTQFRITPKHNILGSGTLFYMINGWQVEGKGSPPGENTMRQGDYTYWDGPNYKTSNPELFPKYFDGSENIEVNIPFSSNAFREPQTVHSLDHASANNYSVNGSQVPVKKNDLRWAGLPSYDSVTGFLAGKAITGIFGGNPSLELGYFRGDPIEFIMEYRTADGKWRPYQRAEFTYFNTWSDHYFGGKYYDTASWYYGSALIDPRTGRFGGIGSTNQTWAHGNAPNGAPQTGLNYYEARLNWPEGASMRWENQRMANGKDAGVVTWWRWPSPNTGWSYNGGQGFDGNGFNQAGCVENDQVAWDSKYTLAYKDPDDVLRPGVAADNVWGQSILGNPMSRRYKVNLNNGVLTKDASLDGRPRILNRPFRSVGELAYAFRGTPWRDIDFLHPSSPDAGLLDVFSLYENPDEDAADYKKTPIVSGRVNINSANKETLAAILRDTSLDDGRYLTPALATTMASDIYDWINSKDKKKGPLDSKAALVAPGIPNEQAQGLIYELSKKLTNTDDRSIKDRREFAVRALSDGTTMRSWDFLLDLVVQSGQLPPLATGLDKFRSASEQRFWVHFAIDRPSGQVIAVQWESVVD